MQGGLRQVPRVVWFLALGRFVTSVSGMVFLFLTLYLVGPRDFSVTHAGLVAGSYGAGALLGNLTGGRWGDRFGHERVMLTCSTFTGLVIASVPWQPDWLLPISLPLALYVGATAGVSVGALSALAVPRGERRTSVAIGRAASNAGFILGPPMGALISTHSWTALFLIDGLALVATRMILAPVLPRRAPVEHTSESKAGLFAALRADRSLAVLLAGVVLADLVYRQLYTTVPLHLKDSGQPVGLYAALVAIGSGLILVLEIPTALRLRRFPSEPIVAAGYVLMGVGFLMFGLPVGVATAVVAMVVITAGEILYKTTATAHVLDAAPDHLVGQYQGLYTAAATSGTMLAAPAGALLYSAAPALVWPACAVVTLGAAGAVLAARARSSAAEAA
jgi:MFS family permease